MQQNPSGEANRSSVFNCLRLNQHLMPLLYIPRYITFSWAPFNFRRINWLKHVQTKVEQLNMRLLEVGADVWRNT